jgi:hypothetical protein
MLSAKAGAGTTATGPVEKNADGAGGAASGGDMRTSRARFAEAGITDREHVR